MAVASGTPGEARGRSTIGSGNSSGAMSRLVPSMMLLADGIKSSLLRDACCSRAYHFAGGATVGTATSLSGTTGQTATARHRCAGRGRAACAQELRYLDDGDRSARQHDDHHPLPAEPARLDPE